MTSAKSRRLAAFEASDRSITGRHNDWDRMTPFTRYDPETGAILETGDMAVAALDQMETTKGWAVIRQASERNTHYVDISGLKPRRRCCPTCPATLDGTTLTGLPVPCTITITDESWERTVIENDEPSLKLMFDYPGAYAVTVRSVPYTDGVFTIEV